MGLHWSFLDIALAVCLSSGMLLSETRNARAEDEMDQAPWKTRIELSYVTASGNTDTQTLSGKLGAKKEEEIHRYYLKGTVLNAEGRGEETANKLLLDGRWERVLRERLFGFVTASYLKDEFSGYDYRMAGGPGLGYDLVRTEEHKLKCLISAVYSYDKFSEDDKSSDSYISRKVAIEYEWQVLQNLRFKENADYLVSFEDTDKYFINSETALEVKVDGSVSFGVSYTIAYQNKPPFPDIEHTDKVFLVSLIIDF
jgi:putative salt-induced outer membrane protein